ncbi:MAG: helix-turn-helix domain-containing protein [Eubacterium sp.]|nr:helix-turn-helix domain-containing protein [Eubacterium sp.]
MKLSMWIFADWLKEYNPDIHIREGKLEIETVRLFSAEMPTEDNTLYIGRIRDLFIHGNNNIICTHKNDILILSTNDLDEVMNQVLNAFEYYQRWNVAMLEAISSDARPADVLAIADEVINEPIYLLDSNQYAIALSAAFGLGDVNPHWDQLLTVGTTDTKFLSRINREVPGHLKTRGLYCFEADFIPQRAFNYNMFLDNDWIGLSSMVERVRPMPQYKLDLFHIFCQNMELWYLSHSREQQTLVIDSMFREALLHDGPVSETFLRRCELHFRDLNNDYYLLALTASAEHSLLMSHVCKEINLAFPNTLAIIHQEYICVLFNDEKKQGKRCLNQLLPLLKRNNYYGGYSIAFSGPGNLLRHFQEASYAAKRANSLQTLCAFEDCALSYALGEIRAHMPVSLIHPAVLKLAEYDRTHNTAFTETLHMYLKKERSQSKTAAALNLHRNTLTYRLQRIRELLPADLEDDDTRLHLLLSFRFLQ